MQSGSISNSTYLLRYRRYPLRKKRTKGKFRGYSILVFKVCPWLRKEIKMLIQISKTCFLIAILAMSSNTFAETPFYIAQDGDYSLELSVSGDGETLCETHIEVSSKDSFFNLTDCRLVLTELSSLELVGELKGDEASGSFGASFKIFDISPWTAVLRDQSVEFGTRIEKFKNNLRPIAPDIDDWLKIRRPEISATSVIETIELEIGRKLPRELAALVTHDISVYDHSYIGPAFLKRWPNKTLTWPTLTDREIDGGVPESALPLKGSDKRNQYDRLRVVFENVGDGIAPIVWDPIAVEGEPEYFWLHEDDREITPFLYLDGSPVNAQDALLAPLSWNNDWVEYGPEEGSWVYNAIKSTGRNPEDINLIVVDKQNQTATLSLSFEQKSAIPLFRSVTPHLTFMNQTWWQR